MTDLELGAAIPGIVQRELQTNPTIVQLANHATSMSLVIDLLMKHLNCKDAIVAELQKLADAKNSSLSVPVVAASNDSKED